MAYKRISPMPIVEGGTNATSMATTDGTVYYDGTRLVTTATGTTGQVLTSAGAGVAPSYSSLPTTTFNQITVQTFTSSGTYTPTTGMKYCTIEVVGGGGGGGGTTTTGATDVSVGSGGGAGGYGRETVTAATVGASQAVTVGTGGAGGAVGGGNGGTGNTSSVGAIVSATGGGPGIGSGAGASAGASGGAGGVGSSGDLNASGGSGMYSVAFFTPNDSAQSGAGGQSIFGAGGSGRVAGGALAGNAGQNYGGGGGGAALSSSRTQQAGGAGADGIVIITEFIHT